MLSLRQVAIAACSLLFLSPTLLVAQETHEPAEGRQLIDREHRRILTELDRQDEWDFEEVPLREVLESFGQRFNAHVFIDMVALEDYGIGADTPVTFALKGISNRSVLNLVLRDLDLSWRLRDGQLWISTIEELESDLLTVAYPVGDLVRVANATSKQVAETTGFEGLGGGGGFGAVASKRSSQEREFHYDPLIDVITSTVEPDSWDMIGGPGSIEGIYGSLVISQTNEVHQSVNRVLAGVRSILAQIKRVPDSVPAAVVVGHAGDQKTRAELAKPTNLEFHETPLREVIEAISELHNLPVAIDHSSLEDYGVGTDTPVTRQISDLPLASVLRTILHELDLTYVVQDEVLMVTTVEEAESLLQIHLYPVGDLVAPLAAEYGMEDCEDNNCDFDTLINTITSTVEPDSWDTIGGPGSITDLSRPPILPIAQTEEIHSQIRDLLTTLRKVKKHERQSR